MQIVIIAGGEGKRMRPLTTHKSLYSFLGKPLVAHLFPNLDPQHNKIYIVTSPSSIEAFKESLPGQAIEYIIQNEPNGMAGALIATKSVLDLDQPILIISAAKILDQIAFTSMLAKIKTNPKMAYLAVRKIEQYKDGGYLKIEGDKVIGIVEKPGADNIPSPYYKLILDYFPRSGEFIEYLIKAKTANDDQYEVGLTNYLHDHRVEKLVVGGTHVSIKHAYNILDVMKLTLTTLLVPGVDRSASIAKTAIIEGDVMIDAGAKVLDYAIIKGPAYIGRNVTIGNGALVRESCVEEGSQIGYGSEIARSYLGPKTKGHMMYVGDSIIEGSVNLSAGTVLANYRFDHVEVLVAMPGGKVNSGRKKFGSIIAKNTITGVNSSLMPGTVIGANAKIGSGCVVKGFVKDGTSLYTQFSHEAN